MLTPSRIPLFSLALATLFAAFRPDPASAEPPCGGYYTYRYGYNPGYYGCSTRPRDPGDKPGLPSGNFNSLYRYVPTSPPPASRAPGTQPKSSPAR